MGSGHRGVEGRESGQRHLMKSGQSHREEVDQRGDSS